MSSRLYPILHNGGLSVTLGVTFVCYDVFWERIPTNHDGDYIHSFEESSVVHQVIPERFRRDHEVHTHKEFKRRAPATGNLDKNYGWGQPVNSTEATYESTSAGNEKRGSEREEREL